MITHGPWIILLWFNNEKHKLYENPSWKEYVIGYEKFSEYLRHSR